MTTNFYICLFCQQTCVFQNSNIISSWWKCEICQVEYQTRHLSNVLMSINFAIIHEGEIYYLEINYILNNTEVYKFGNRNAVVTINQVALNVKPNNALDKLMLYMVFS